MRLSVLYQTGPGKRKYSASQAGTDQETKSHPLLASDLNWKPKMKGDSILGFKRPGKVGERTRDSTGV